VLALEGDLEGAFEMGGVSADIEEGFARDLRAGRGRDAAAGRALTGPHRSDLMVRHGPKDMPASLSSTGEQKALLLGIVIAHVRALSQDPSAGPALLLLDEAGAHLDFTRRAALAQELMALPGQAWLTGTDASLFEAFASDAQVCELKDQPLAGH
jgi:DNA replication and repair protein RecF